MTVQMKGTDVFSIVRGQPDRQFAVSAGLREDDIRETRDLTDTGSDCAAIWEMIEQPAGPPSILDSQGLPILR